MMEHDEKKVSDLTSSSSSSVDDTILHYYIITYRVPYNQDVSPAGLLLNTALMAENGSIVLGCMEDKIL